MNYSNGHETSQKPAIRLVLNAKYLLLFPVILSIEVLIALFVRDQFVRPFVGDVLVVPLMYALVRGFLDTTNNIILAASLVCVAYLVEIGQYFQLFSRLGLGEVQLATIVLGTTFDWRDLLAYTIGFILILLGLARKTGNS